MCCDGREMVMTVKREEGETRKARGSKIRMNSKHSLQGSAERMSSKHSCGVCEILSLVMHV